MSGYCHDCETHYGQEGLDVCPDCAKPLDVTWTPDHNQFIPYSPWRLSSGLS